MSDKVNVEEIIGLVKTDEVTNSVEEVRKLRGRGERMNDEKISILLPQVGDVRFTEEKGWETYLNKNGVEWCPIPMIDVPVDELLMKWEDLVHELSEKEVRLVHLKEYIQSQSFHLETTVDFKEIYGKNNADIRKQHIRMELDEVFNEVRDLELSINWIKQYIPLLKEVIRSKQ